MRKCGKGVRQRAATREQDGKITLVYCDYAEKQSKSEVLQHKCMFSDTKTILGELKYGGGGGGSRETAQQAEAHAAILMPGV